MGRISDWLIGMEEDAPWMSRKDFIQKHGASSTKVWEEAREDRKELRLNKLRHKYGRKKKSVNQKIS
jgi:hypothetical protein